MSDITTQRNIGSLIAPVTGVFPQSAATGTVNGVSIDRTLHNLAGSCEMLQAIGSASGAPTALSVQTTLQHSPDNVTWSNYQFGGVTQQTAALTTANSSNTAAIDLTGAYRFIRTTTTIAFTGGTTPTIPITTNVVLGGERVLVAA
jgi:hypothetical protein